MQKPTKINHQATKARLFRKGRGKNLAHAYLKHPHQKQEPHIKNSLSSQEKQAKRIVGFIKRHAPAIVICTGILFCLAGPVFAVKVGELVDPVNDLKDTIFGGWMWVPKIGAAVGGCLLAVYNQSIMPLATGAGIGLGIHFYDLYIDASGALI